MSSTFPFPKNWHYKPHPEVIENFVSGKTFFVTEVTDYDIYRSMLYGLGAKGVYQKMMKDVDTILYGGTKVPKKATDKYPQAPTYAASLVTPLFHQEITSFAEYIKALKKEGFRVRNFSDEGDPDFDFSELDLVDNDLCKTVLHYLHTSPFIGGFIAQPSFPLRDPEEGFEAIVFPNRNLTWWLKWSSFTWTRVGAQRGDGDYPLEIKGSQMAEFTQIFWTETVGVYFYEYPEVESVSGLFIQAGIDARTGKAHVAAISRVWT